MLLDISYNRIGDQVAERLASALKENSTRTSLDGSVRIGDQGRSGSQRPWSRTAR